MLDLPSSPYKDYKALPDQEFYLLQKIMENQCKTFALFSA